LKTYFRNCCALLAATLVCPAAVAVADGSRPWQFFICAGALGQTSPPQGPAAAAPSASRFAPLSLLQRKDNTPPDPFAAAKSQGAGIGTPTGGAAAPGARPQSIPPGTPPTNRPNDSAAGQPAARLASPDRAARAQSDSLLIAARRALAVGDSRRAQALVDQAQRLQVKYDYLDDSPAKIAEAIGKHHELMQSIQRHGGTPSAVERRQQANLMMEQSEALRRWQELDEAERLARDVSRMGVTFTPYETTPQTLLERIAASRQGASAAGIKPLPPVTSAAAPTPLPPQQPAYNGASLIVSDNQVVPAVGQPGPPAGPYPETRAIYDRSNDPTRNMPAAAQQPINGLQRFPAQEAIPSPQPAASLPGATPRGVELFQQGEQALKQGQVPQALDLFRQAHGFRNELDPQMQQRLQGYLLDLSRPQPAPAGPGALIQNATTEQEQLRKKIAADVAVRESEARRIQENDPKRALAMMQEIRAAVEPAALDAPSREALLRRVDRSIAEMQRYLDDNQARIELNERNAATRAEIKREETVRVEVQNDLAKLVDEFNKLMDERRYAEAEVVAKKAGELAPDEPVVRQLKLQSQFVRNFMNNTNIRDLQQRGLVRAMESVSESAIPFDDRNPIDFGDPKSWQELTLRRKSQLEGLEFRRSEKELEIQQKLKTPVSLRFQNAPLSQVLDYLAKLAQVNMHVDPQGLLEEGVNTNTPVTIDLSQDISLKSALNLILEPLHLAYVIEDEVLKVTSETLRGGTLITVPYNVADLVIPIPNFAPNGNIGMGAALRDAYGSAAAASGFGAQSPLAVVASKDGAPSNAMIDPAVLAQVSASSAGGLPAMIPGKQMGNGPGGLGGAALADFDSLIDLITSTIAPTTWDDVGGPGSIQPFATNLSLVVSQTQDVHEQIVDLLEQLRRLQDLQVTIEVRFITLNDNFFERIGLDFDFQIDDNIDRPFQVFGQPDPAFDGLDDPGGVEASRDVSDRDHGPKVVVGRSSNTAFSADLDIPFNQGSFGLAVPQFGGFDPSAAATMGFAILSDIEAFFFIEAVQGDRRSNVLQAPKVTLFNGQQAFVSDTSQSPFVISVIPVVGDFAAAHQPVIVILSEGTFLTVQAVVSADRRFVRLTVVPFFSSIGEVNTFTFVGSDTTTTDSSSEGPDDETTGRTNRTTRTTSGTTVQLPTFSFVTVTTTVSVPDGGTILMGGIKRLSEGRNEFGVPLLNKIPYINRLFSNVGIGRETQSLMMMVTPRIIIQEEEEANLLGTTPVGP